MKTPAFDVIVVGVGGIGSAAVEQLSRRGLRVLGLDRFSPPHTYGSTHGGTRLIRKAYFEDTRYLPLLHRSYTGWHQLSERAGERLYTPCGFLVLSEGTPAMPSVGPTRSERLLAVAAAHGVALEALTPAELRARFSQFKVDDSWQAQLEPDAGYLAVERCVEAQLKLALEAGAELRFAEGMVRWRGGPGHVVVETEQGRYEAGALVLALGAWTPALAAELGLPLVVRRGPQFWFRGGPGHHVKAGMPCFAFSTAEAFIYGFPDLGEGGLKIASYEPSGVLDDPLERDPAYSEAELAPVASAVRKHLPGVDPQPARWSICMYTLTPDENFVLDRHPAHDNVFFFAGDSGHAFKFAPALGEVLADWATGQAPGVDVSFLARRAFT